MKIKAIYLKPESGGKFPGDPSPVSVIRSNSVDGRTSYEIDFDVGFYWCRKAGAVFRIPVHNVKFDEPAEEPKRAAKAS